MKTKTITFTSPGVAQLLDTELSAPEGNKVQVKLLTSTISGGTERANLLGKQQVGINGRMAQFPNVVGYCCAGIVTAVGEAVTRVQVGDRVGVSWSKYSSYINIVEEDVHKLPDCVSTSDGAILHIATFPLAAIRKCRLEMGESAIVMGLGVLGLVAIPLLRAAGAAPIIAVDPVPEKREKALSIGADYALDPYASDFAQQAKALTGGGAKVGIEVTGIGAGLDGILDCMAKFGRVALLGCTRDKEFTIDYYRKVHGPGITLIGAHTIARPKQESHEGWWTEQDDYEALIRLTQMGRIKLSDLVDEVHSPKDATAVFDRLAKEPSFPVTQLDWSTLE